MKIFVAQDPYQMGYRGVTLCIAAAKGETVADETAPAVWYYSENMNNPEIAKVLYD